MRERIYFDQAATSWPKPEAVYQAVDRYQRTVGAAAGRGAYAEAQQAERLVEAARRSVARLLKVEDARRIVFTLNGTDSLNLALHGALSAGGHVITTLAEHNSVLRPLKTLEAAGRVTVSRVGLGPSGLVDPDDIRRAMNGETRLIVLTHASNVTGALQPAAEVGRLARQAGALFLLDAAQSLGEMPMDVEQLGVDLLAAPGHKGLLGPLGTGVLYLRPGVEQQVAALRQGGTGSRSDQDWQPELLPDKFESGNLNVPGIAGLGAGAGWLAERGIDQVRQHGLALLGRLLARLGEISGVSIFGPTDLQQRVPLVSLTLAGIDPQELAAALDSSYRIQGRAGLHCAPLMHRHLGTLDRGGTLRLSLGPMNTLEQVDQVAEALDDIARQLR
ncbi:MAG TPA: aminotransferase class V-fold PLP-dependent enzyme [Pirellulales bacterium]|nr:aminotransferase class V-fold PLP-dependent enzyme [Pirellulales bacterium]